MRSVKSCRFGFDPWGLGLFLAVMAPNFVWFALPPPNDIFRAASVTPLLDGAEQALRVVMAAAMCGVVNTARAGFGRPGPAAGAGLCVLLYFAGWAAYYAGIANAAVLLTLCLAPCGAFLLFAWARSNTPALLAAGGFALCHLSSTLINFVL